MYSEVPSLLKDGRLRSIRIEDFETVESLLLHLFVRGTIVQISAVVDNLDASCDLGMPELKRLEREIAQAALYSHIEQCCTFLGVNFAGDLPVFCVTLFDMYAGLSVLEFMRFFDGVRKGRWKSDYQNVSTRGLNPEFLLDWMQQFAEVRDHVVQGLRREIPEATPPDTNVSGLERFKEMQQRESAVSARVHEYRSAIEAARKVRSVETIRIPIDNERSVVFTNQTRFFAAEIVRLRAKLSEAQKSGDVERMSGLEAEIQKAQNAERSNRDKANELMTWVEEDTVMEVDAPGANYQRLEETLLMYYKPFYPEKDTAQLMTLIMQKWELEALVSGESEALKAFYNRQAKVLNAQLRSIEVNPVAIIEGALNELADQSTSAATFLEALGLSSPGITWEKLRPQIKALSRRIESTFTSEKYCEHVEKAFAAGKTPKYRKEYQAYCALYTFVNLLGKHPFDVLFT